jgi:hypothetical protein
MRPLRLCLLCAYGLALCIPARAGAQRIEPKPITVD